MNRKLMLLNVLLAVIVVFAGVQLRKRWKASKEREKSVVVTVKPLPPEKYQSLEPVPAVVATSYNEVAQKLLFHRERNPNVFIEPPPPPPPPPPMPALPVYHGMMNLGSGGPIAVLSVGGGNQAVHPGDSIGQFKLVSVTSEEIVFEWKGQTIVKSTGELTGGARGIAPAQPMEGRTEVPVAAAAPATPALVGPGEDLGGFKRCNVNDGNADGSVVGGFRKVAYSTPFGQSCRWEPVK